MITLFGPRYEIMATNIHDLISVINGLGENNGDDDTEMLDTSIFYMPHMGDEMLMGYMDIDVLWESNYMPDKTRYFENWGGGRHLEN